MYPQALVQKKPGSKAKIIENREGASSYTLGSYSVCALELQGFGSYSVCALELQEFGSYSVCALELQGFGSYSVCALELQGSARTTSPELTADLSLSFPHLATLF